MVQFGFNATSAHGRSRNFDATPMRNSLLRYDPELIQDLLRRHARLAADVAALAAHYADDAARGAAAAARCAEELNELRRWEAIRLYPVISRGLHKDAAAERRWVILRFVINGLAHRLLRSMDALATVAESAEVQPAIDTVLHNLAAYRQRNESELYPLYALMDPCRGRVSA